MKIFFDTEFTGLHQNTTLISIGMIDENNDTFYGEFGDYDYLQINDWLKDNIISKLHFHKNLNKGWCNTSTINSNGRWDTEAYGNKEHHANSIKEWLSKYNSVEMWSDCLAYDWVLFNQLWGHAFNIPKNLFYIPFDICTLFKIKGINPDINREKFIEIPDILGEKHHSLWDAMVIKKCYEKLIRI